MGSAKRKENEDQYISQKGKKDENDDGNLKWARIEGKSDKVKKYDPSSQLHIPSEQN